MQRSRPTSIIRAVLVVLALVTAACGGGTDDTAAPVATTGQVAGGELFLEPVASLGTDPFFDAVDTFVAEPADDIVPVALPSTTPDGPLQYAVGTDPGLYGGSKDSTVCNRGEIIAFLEANPDKAQAWADAQAIPVEDIRGFVESLTPGVLLHDTRVTNHGFAGGVANPIQSVLQAGTAVLIDETGIPRVKCACGNPLRKPVAQTRSVVVGQEWDGFDESRVVAVEGGAATDSFELTDIDSGEVFERVAGTVGDADLESAASAQPGPTTTFSPPNWLTPDTQVAASGAGYSTNAYVELGSDDVINGVLVEGPSSVTLDFNTAGGPFSATYASTLTGEDFDGVAYSVSINASISGTYDALSGQFTGTIAYSNSSSSPAVDSALPTAANWTGGVVECGAGVCAYGSSDNVEIGFGDLALPGVQLSHLVDDPEG